MSLPWLTGEVENPTGVPGLSSQGNNSGELRNSHAGETHPVPLTREDFENLPDYLRLKAVVKDSGAVNDSEEVEGTLS